MYRVQILANSLKEKIGFITSKYVSTYTVCESSLMYFFISEISIKLIFLMNFEKYGSSYLGYELLCLNLSFLTSNEKNVRAGKGILYHLMSCTDFKAFRMKNVFKNVLE